MKYGKGLVLGPVRAFPINGDIMPLEFNSLRIMELRQSPGNILDRVFKNGEAFIIERKGRQKACLVPVSAFSPDIQHMPLEFNSLKIMELRQSPGNILDRVFKNGEAFIIERRGQQKACLVPVSIFLPDIEQQRFNREVEELHRKGEHPKISISATKEIEMRFHENVGDEQITLTIVLPHRYPNTAPKVYALPLVNNTPHRWQDGSLCIFGTIANWNPGEHNIVSLLSLARGWLSSYYQWRNTGQWGSQKGEAL